LKVNIIDSNSGSINIWKSVVLGTENTHSNAVDSLIIGR
jgi:hypothetical protein